MADKNYIIIPGTNIRLYDSDIVRISNYPKARWIVHNGWYIYQGHQNNGWYFESTVNADVLPVGVVDLTLCTLLTLRVNGSEICDGKQVNYTKPFTQADAELLNRTFITVSTIEQRNNIDPKTLIDGRMVRVNSVEGEVKYYSWDSETSSWRDADLGGGSGIPQLIGKLSEPIILSHTKEGLYRILGVYQIVPSSNSTDTTVTNIDYLAFISGYEDKDIKIITENAILDYIVSGDEIISEDRYATEVYVEGEIATLEQKISEIISELSAEDISYTPPLTGVTSNSHTVQQAVDALNEAVGGGDKEVFYGTTEYWNSRPQFIPISGCIYVYSDHDTDEEGKPIAGIKIGDGTSYLIDMPFIDKKYATHIADMGIHVSESDRLFWNNKVRCYIDPDDIQKVIFTTN